MATTTRKRERVKPVKEILKQEEVSEVTKPENEIRDVLEPDHLRMVEVFGLEIDNAKLQMAVEEQSLVNLQLSLENLQSKIESQKVLVNNKAQKYELAKQKFTNYKKQIWPIYGLNENEPMSYDRSSGKIVR